MIFGNAFFKHIAEVAHVLHKVGVHIAHHTTNAVIAHRHAGPTGFVKNIVDIFTLTEGVEECCCSTLVHRQATIGEQVAVQAHQLVHHHAYELGTMRHLNA
ncbi:Uncharacterised protein [Chlamydia trachomatis]|nr:Uncharacterised protein [Chlamydia trachomatis]